jgi:hypothetical protein
VAGDCALEAARRGGMGTTYISYDYEMTRQFIKDVAAWSIAFNLAASEIKESVINDEGKDILSFSVKFASGNTIAALSSKPRNIRSRKGRLILDEYAFHDDPEELLKAAIALTIWGAKIDIISSVNGLCEHFEDLCHVIAPARGYSVHTITFDDAIADGLYKRICLVAGEQWSEEKEQDWRSQVITEYGLDADEELFCKPNKRKGTLAFNHFDRFAHVQPVEFDPVYPIHLSFDFNRNPATGTIAQHVGTQINIIDEIYLPGADTFQLGREARLKVDRLNPYLIYVHGDASGRSMTANSQQSNWDIIAGELIGLALNWQVPIANPPITDTLNSSNSLLKQGKVSIDPRCVELIRDLETCKLLADGKPDKKSDPMRFQVGDTFRYLLHDLDPYRSAKSADFGQDPKIIVGGQLKRVNFS